MTVRTVMLVASMGVVAGGCVGGTHLDGWEDGDETGTRTTSQSRTVDARFGMMTKESAIVVNARRLEVTGGAARILVRSDGKVTLDALDLTLADQDLTKSELPPRGVALRNIRAKLVKSVTASADVSGDVRFARVTADMELSWSYITESGAPASLTPQLFERLTVDVSLVDDGARAIITAKKDGEVWTWNGHAMRDLVLDLTLARDPVVASSR